ncbi:extracellular solute-binding protein [Jeotgalibacillus soli]|uniref:HTH gntR-type domain-containing protein n=1 Tax=Jeotgalibacillus soli TaxID=889306 RepID=A0A0C2RI58_9BACL|nr:extracellular solute-binding protein [Jeotgalibacillus soli]KIL49850.1 hypothetical protein KP78_13180 [Jeotgalibacillus soli]
MVKKTSREEFTKKLDNMMESIRDSIMKGEIQVGEYLPSELALVEEFQLSKNSVRKGLEILVQEGFIVKKSRVGNIVVSNRPFDQTILRVGYYPTLGREIRFHTLVKKFEEAYPSIKVQTIALSYEHYRQNVGDFFENDMIDAVTINLNDFDKFKGIQHSYFEPLPIEEDIYSFVTAPFQTEQSTYVQPLTFSPIVLCYNREHFDKADIGYPDSSWTWEKLLQQADGLKKANVDLLAGFYFHPLSVNRWPIFLLQQGLRFQREEGMRKVNGEQRLIKAARLLRKLFDEQDLMQTFLSDSDRDAEALFLEGRLSMVMTSYFSLNEMAKSDIPFDLAPLPYAEEAKTLLLSIGLAVNAQSSRKQAAECFVRYMTGEEAQEIIRRETLSIPARKSVAEITGNEKIVKPSRYYLYRETVPTFSPFSALGLSQADVEILRKELRYYFSGMMSEEMLGKRAARLLEERVQGAQMNMNQS